jgi:xanthine dehydrogenase accessory factor
VTREAVEARATALRAERVPFVLARVVRAERPTSAKPGDEAIVFGDGTIEGFVGGTCAESTVRAQGSPCSTRAGRCCCASRRAPSPTATAF